VIAVITAKGEIKMTDLQDKPAVPEGAEPAPEPVAAKKRHAGAHARHFATSKGKRPKEAPRVAKADSRAGSAASAKKGAAARPSSKTAKFMALLKRPGGATGVDLMKATGWQAHSVRGFISGVLGRRMGLKVSSETENGQRRYALKA
jgi:hypothetical protein